MDLNSVCLSGRLSKDPELRYTPSGTAVCDMIVACNYLTKESHQATVFVRVTIWGKQAQRMGHPQFGLKRTDAVTVQGQVADDNFEREKGNPKTRTSGRLKIDQATVFVQHSETFSPRDVDAAVDALVEEPEDA